MFHFFQGCWTLYMWIFFFTAGCGGLVGGGGGCYVRRSLGSTLMANACENQTQSSDCYSRPALLTIYVTCELRLTKPTHDTSKVFFAKWYLRL